MTRRWLQSVDVEVNEATGALRVEPMLPVPPDVEVQHVPVDASEQGDNELVAAAEGKRTYVLRGRLIAGDEVNATLKGVKAGEGEEEPAETVLAGPMKLTAGGGFNIECPSDLRLCEAVTGAGESLVLELDAEVQVGGYLKVAQM